MTMKRDYRTVLEEARTAMELFDLASELMVRVRGSQATQMRAASIAEKCRFARNAQLRPLDAARSRLTK